MSEWAKEQLEQRILAVVREVLPSSPDVFDERLLIREDLGADSMQVIALMIAFDSEFDIEFNADDLPDAGVSMGWLRDFITRMMVEQREP